MRGVVGPGRCPLTRALSFTAGSQSVTNGIAAIDMTKPGASTRVSCCEKGHGLYERAAGNRLSRHTSRHCQKTAENYHAVRT